MKIENFIDYKGGWLVGDFTPSLFKRKNIEVGVKYLYKGFIDQAHFHVKSTEFNLLLKGRLQQNGIIIEEKQFFIFSPKDVSKVSVLEDSIVLVIRDGSDINDKFTIG